MYGKVVSFDIGSFNVRAQYAKISFKSIIVEQKIIFKRLKGESTSDLIRRFQALHDTGDHTPILLFPSEKLQYRILSFPFRSEKEIRAVLKPELDALLPNQDEDLITDFIIMSEAEKPVLSAEESENETNVNIVSVSVGKEIFSDYLDPWLESKFVPGYVGIESVSLNSLSHSYPDLNDHQIKLFLDLGYSKTLLTIASGKDLRYIRVIPIGAADFNSIIIKESGIEEDGVDNIRIMLGNLLWGQNEISALPKNEQKALEKVLKQAGLTLGALKKIQQSSRILFSELLREIRLSIFSHFQQWSLSVYENDTQQINRIILLGGFSRQEGIREVISHALNIPVYDFPNLKTDMDQIQGDGEEGDFLISHGFLNSIAHNEAKSNINLLQDEFSALSMTRKGSSFKAPIYIIATSFFLLIANLFFVSYLKGKEESSLEMELKTIVQKHFPDVPLGNDLVRAIRGFLVEREGKTGDPRAVPVVKFIDVIKSITMAMEKTQDFKMKDLKYSTERLTLQGTVPKVSSAEEIKKILEETGIFESINDPKVRKEMGRDTWVISIDARVSSKAKDK